jgi:hypothetical protein
VEKNAPQLYALGLIGTIKYTRRPSTKTNS